MEPAGAAAADVRSGASHPPGLLIAETSRSHGTAGSRTKSVACCSAGIRCRHVSQGVQPRRWIQPKGQPQVHKERLGFVQFFPQPRGGPTVSERIGIVFDFAPQQLSVFIMPLPSKAFLHRKVICKLHSTR
jgi:hypothetical protein